MMSLAEARRCEQAARHNEQVARIARELRQLRGLDNVSSLYVALKAELPLHPVERLLDEAVAMERRRRALWTGKDNQL